MVEVYRAIYSALESSLHLIRSVIDAESQSVNRWQWIYQQLNDIEVSL